MVKPSKWIVAVVATGVLAVVPAAAQEDSRRHDHAEAKGMGMNPMNVTHARCRAMLGMN